jgi:hypothetical protein
MVYLSGTLTPFNNHASFSSLIILLRAYVTIRNKKWDIGHPYRSPLDALKFLEGDPLIITKNETDSMHPRI